MCQEHIQQEADREAAVAAPLDLKEAVRRQWPTVPLVASGTCRVLRGEAPPPPFPHATTREELIVHWRQCTGPQSHLSAT